MRLKRNRRGVLLLLVLALLAMFGLVAVSFVVVTGHAMRSARAIQRIGQTTVDPEADLNEAFGQVVRGSDNTASVMGPHSLLEDIYGNGAVKGTIGSVTEVCGGQILTFEVGTLTDWEEVTPLDSTEPQRRVGCVLTMLDGPAAGHSTRIVGYDANTGTFQVLAFDGVSSSDVAAHKYMINGVPFSGTGFGYDDGTGELDAKDTTLTAPANQPLALLPGSTLNDTPVGGANEDYDAPDFQNMLLAMQIDHAGSVRTIPSLHRPALVRYWKTQQTATWDSTDWSVSGPLRRRVILRPLPGDHPFFDGSNPSAAADPDWDGTDADDQWDVDNDGDGQTDGIWVDLGMPVRSTADGRLYKPLFSILCVDMDGRLNLNAHGNLAQVNATYYDPANVDPESNGYRLAGGLMSAQLPRGQGYGPAEVNLAALFAGDSAEQIVQYQKLLVGDGTYEGRYGQGGLPGRAGDDALGQNRNFEFWQDSEHGSGWEYDSFSAAGYKPDTYGSPPDLNGNGYLGLDPAGRPVYCNMAEQGEQIDDPYELDLSPGKARGLSASPLADNPFSVAELERLLRPFDRDAGQLPRRLAALTPDPDDPSISRLMTMRHSITTESWDLPVPGVALSRGLWAMLREKGVLEENIPAMIRQLLPPEMLAGLKMDLNRPLGDGIDNDGNGVVDEPGETDQSTLYSTPNTTVTVSPFSYSPDGTVPNSLVGRQLLARHLYVLMMLLADTDYLKDPSRLGSDAAVAHYVAQWAVNVVDFRDRDSIMTPFMYDVDPFDATGWDAPVGPPPASGWDPQYVVWGCERPELLITETLAFHDRRTEDLETPDKKTTATDPDVPDADFDQRLCPQGSLFVELFNPWTSMEPEPVELCTAANGGVDLKKRASDGSPVWRLVVVEPDADPNNIGEPKDPDDPVAANRPTIERSVYFVDLSGGAFDDPADGQVVHYPSAALAANIAPVLPGRYTVVGPGELNQPVGTTYIGQRVDDNLATTRRIVLTPNANPAVTGQVKVFENNNGASDDLALVSIQSATAVVIDKADPAVADVPLKRPRRLSISEPTGGYPAENPPGIAYDVDTGYTEPFDEPLDVGKAMATEVMKNATTTGVRVLHLQRLANPLLPWNVTTNPYLTIDSAPVDLTAFNGVTADPEKVGGVAITSGPTMFHTRERGDKDTLAPGLNNLWKQEPIAKTVDDEADNAALATHYFQKLLTHSLGYLNAPFGTPTSVAGKYLGDPQLPFPWLTWNNRPFVSQMELLLVPALRSSKLLVANTNSPLKYFNIVRSGDAPEPYGPTTLQNVPYQHLLNFFQSQLKTDSDHSSPQLHRLLEYVYVPSRFAGTQLQGNPAKFAGSGLFQPPFNLISRYREPGRVNLNTIMDWPDGAAPPAFRGLMDYFPDIDVDALWATFSESRRGYADGEELNYPTEFARPFRSFAGANLVPLDGMKPDREIDATLLRSNYLDDTSKNKPLFNFESPNAYNNTDRNPFFRYQALERLGNLVTTRSNVYAVWITVGYFEVERVPTDAVHPDGFQLMSELGIDTGEVKRHRAFYIYDRSIPVGFRRGEDLNVEAGVLLRRFIE